MAEYNDLAEKGEAALQAVIREAGTGIDALQVFTSFSDDGETMGPACVSINCVGGLEDGHGSGNERLSFSIKLKSAADRVETDGELEDPGAPKARHRLLLAKLVDVLKQPPDELAADLTDAVEDFTVFDSIVFRRGALRTENRKFVSELMVEFSCAPSDVS